jgi:integrase
MERRLRLPKYVQGFLDRHGAPRHYFRRPGAKRIPLPGLPWSPEFMAAYELAAASEMVSARALEVGASRTKPGTLNDATVKYYRSMAFNQLAQSTQAMRRAVLERFRSERGDNNPVARGERPLKPLTREHLAKIIHKQKPFAQRNLLKTLRGLFAFAVEDGLIADDPTIGIKPVKVGKSEGFHNWTDDDIAQFERVHPIGSKPRLAFALMLYLGLRRGDVVRIGPQHVRNGEVRFTPQKTSRSTGFVLDCRLHPELARIIAATPCGHLSFLTTEYGKPFTAAGLGMKMRAWCDEAGLPECSAHGLRKGFTRRAAEAGCTVHQIQAITGHADLRVLAKYTEAVNKRELARAAIERLAGENKPRPKIVKPAYPKVSNRGKR